MGNLNPGVASSSNANTTPIINGLQLLWIIRSANFGITTDQVFTKCFTGNSWDPINIIANWVSGASGGSPAGGVFPDGRLFAELTGRAGHQSRQNPKMKMSA